MLFVNREFAKAREQFQTAGQDDLAREMEEQLAAGLGVAGDLGAGLDLEQTARGGDGDGGRI
ncbi:MAG: hypothetical protein HYR94_04995 [Chloroflexi bacterium]|nr:hypothetical protein [Chloroflexota bacterium]